MYNGRKLTFGLAAIAAMGMVATSAFAVKMYGPGVTDDSIKLGNTMPYSGPAAAYGQIGKSTAAYFDKIN